MSQPEPEVPAYESIGDGPVLLYDGHCATCDRAVRLVLRFDRRGDLRFAPLSGVFAHEVLARHPCLRGVDSLVWVRNPSQGDERVFVRSEALELITDYLGGPWRAFAILRLLPRRFMDAAYDLFARRRHQVFRRYDECRIPPPETLSRFLV